VKFGGDPIQSERPAGIRLVPTVNVGGKTVKLAIFNGVQQHPLGISFHLGDHIIDRHEVRNNEDHFRVPGSDLLEVDSGPAIAGVGIFPNRGAAGGLNQVGLHPAHGRDVKGDGAVFVRIIQQQGAGFLLVGQPGDSRSYGINLAFIPGSQFFRFGWVLKELTEGLQIALILVRGFKIEV